MPACKVCASVETQCCCLTHNEFLVNVFILSVMQAKVGFWLRLNQEAGALDLRGKKKAKKQNLVFYLCLFSKLYIILCHRLGNPASVTFTSKLVIFFSLAGGVSIFLSSCWGLYLHFNVL